MLFVEKSKKLRFVFNWINEIQKIFRKLPKINITKTINLKTEKPPVHQREACFHTSTKKLRCLKNYL